MDKTEFSKLFPIIKNESQAARAYRLLELRIVSLDLKPGQAITESELCDYLDLGRTPVREALQRLAQEWLVKVLPRRGMIVSEVDLQCQMRLIEARRAMEGSLIRIATRKASKGQREQFRTLAAGFLEAADKADEFILSETDSDFNQLVFEVAGNEFLVSALQRMHALSRRFWKIQSQFEDILHVTAMTHADLADAIASGDAEAAVAATEKLLDNVEAYTRAALDRS
ncbi:MAG: GntR family transcriptional regulator [Burkholderiales bacterium]|nr:GntR family transcriptional regulator [Burkholderiales bacterium]